MFLNEILFHLKLFTFVFISHSIFVRFCESAPKFIMNFIEKIWVTMSVRKKTDTAIDREREKERRREKDRKSNRYDELLYDDER